MVYLIGIPDQVKKQNLSVLSAFAVRFLFFLPNRPLRSRRQGHKERPFIESELPIR